MDDQKAPASWYIWIVFWILPILLSLGTYQDDLGAAIGTWVGTGVLVILMVVKAKWVLPWFCVILIFDLIGFGFLLGEDGGIRGSVSLIVNQHMTKDSDPNGT